MLTHRIKPCYNKIKGKYNLLFLINDKIKYILERDVVKCCADCKERKIGCHSKCSRYAEFKKKIDAKNKVMKSENLRKTWGKVI
jgi:hypothetical protein